MRRCTEWVRKLRRKIRHHRDMKWKRRNDPEQRTYHENFQLATERELEEYLSDQGVS
jgi:hypothetical protein